MAGEFEFINWLRTQQATSERVLLPAGDDMAILRWRSEDLLLVGVDQVLDGIHFDSAVHDPVAIGRKVMNRNLSDCAAMACLPTAAVATVALPQGRGMEYARQLYLGLRSAADPFNCALVGGDTGAWDGKLVLTVTILGRSDGLTPVRRSAARAGDEIFVTGALGGSILGRHMTFEPRVLLARELAATGRVTAMIDLSDGLARDLRHICRESGVGADVSADAIPIHADARALSTRESADRAQQEEVSLSHAIGDGEDYELLLTAMPGAAMPGCTRIGVITRSSELCLVAGRVRRPLAAAGWEHTL